MGELLVAGRDSCSFAVRQRSRRAASRPVRLCGGLRREGAWGAVRLLCCEGKWGRG